MNETTAQTEGQTNMEPSNNFIPKISLALKMNLMFRDGQTVFNTHQVRAMTGNKAMREHERQSTLTAEQKEWETKESDLRDQMHQKHALEIKAWNDEVAKKRVDRLQKRKKRAIIFPEFVPNKSARRRAVKFNLENA